MEENNESNLPTSDRVRQMATSLGIDYDAVRRETNLDDAAIMKQLLQAPPEMRVGPTIAAAEAQSGGRINVDIDKLYKDYRYSEEDIARYYALLAGLNYPALREAGASNADIISQVGTPESVRKYESSVRLQGEESGRAIVKGAPSFFAGLAGAMAGAPTGPVTAAGLSLAAAAAAQPVGDELERLIYGEPVPLVPSQRGQQAFAQTLGYGSTFLPAASIAAKTLPSATMRILENRSRLASTRFGKPLTPVENLLTGATLRPGRQALEETLGVLGAAGAGATAENYLPGDELARLSAELAGGVLIPQRHMAAILSKAGDAVFGGDAGGAGILTERSKNAFANVLREVLIEAKEDPAAILAQLPRREGDKISDDALARLAEERGIDLGDRPTITYVDSPTLRALHQTFALLGDRAGPTQAKARTQALIKNMEGVETLIAMMRSSEDPQLVSAAATLWDDYTRAALDETLDLALARATAVSDKIARGDVVGANQDIVNAMSEAVRAGRRQENIVWRPVDKKIPVNFPEGSGGSAIATEFADIESKLLPTSTFELDKVRAAVNRLVPQAAEPEEGVGRAVTDAESEMVSRLSARWGIGGEEDGAAVAAETTVGDLLRFKSDIFQMAQRARAQGNSNEARLYDRLIGATYDDLRAGTAAVNDQALSDANAYSAAFNDVFTRGYAGDVLAPERSGAPRIQPETLHLALAAGGADKMNLRLREIDAAAAFVGDLDAEVAGPNLAKTLGGLPAAQETILRALARRQTRAMQAAGSDAEAELLRQGAVKKFLEDNEEALKRFPNLLADLQDARTQLSALARVTKDDSAARKALDSEAWFQFAINEKPHAAVTAAIGDPNSRPADQNAANNLNRLIRRINQGAARGGFDPELGKEGLLNTVLDNAFVYAGGELAGVGTPAGTAGMDFGAVRDYLFKPLGQGQKSAILILKDGGVIDDAQIMVLNQFLKSGENIQQTLRRGESIEEFVNLIKEEPFLNLALIGRFLGARQAAQFQKMMNVSTIQIPAEGAKLGQRLANKLPRSGLPDVVRSFLDDPAFAREILERSVRAQNAKGRNARGQMQALFRSLEDHFIKSGIIVSGAAGVREGQEVMSDVEEMISNQGAAAPSPEAQTAAPRPAQAPVQMPAPPRPRQPAPVPRPAAPPPPPPPPPAAPSAPTRAGYAAMFPNDPISSVIQGQQAAQPQGIESLMPR